MLCFCGSAQLLGVSFQHMFGPLCAYPGAWELVEQTHVKSLSI